MLEVRSAEYVDEYKIKILFSTGESKIVDLSNDLNGEIFEPLKKKEYFKTFCFNSEIGTICWDNGADIAPEYLYKLGST